MAHIREVNKINKLLDENKSVQENTTLNIDKNQKLTFDETNQNLKINIKENIEVEITHIIEKENSLNELEITLNKNSKLILKQLIKSARYVNIKTNIKQNAQFEQKIIYLIDSEESFIKSTANLEEEYSIANMTIKGAAGNGARVICDGIININKAAKEAQASQEIRGILLDSKSNIQNEPTLEINNNDVICSHAASIVQVKDDVKFFMKSRGLNLDEIKKIIIDGLVGEIITDE